MLPVELAETSRQHGAHDPGELDQPTPAVEPVETRLIWGLNQRGLCSVLFAHGSFT